MTDYRTSMRYSLTAQDRSALAVAGGVVVALHLLGAGALLAFPVGIGVLAYLVGLRRAFDPANIAVVGETARKLDDEGRPAVSAGFWFAAGYSAAVYFLALVLATGADGLLNTSWSGVFAGILGIVSVIVLIGAILESRRKTAPESRNERLVRRVRQPWQLLVVGGFFAFGSSLVVEVALLVLAAEAALPRVTPWYSASVLTVLFAAGMCLTGTAQGAVDAVSRRAGLLRIALAAGTALVAVWVSMVRFPDFAIDLPNVDVPERFDITEGPLAELGSLLLDNLGLLLLLGLVVLGVVAFRRFRKGKADSANSQQQPVAASRQSGFNRSMTRVLGRQRAGAQQQPAHSPAPARRQPSPQPAYYGRANRPAPAPSPTPAPAFAQSPVYQQSPAPVQQRVVARAAVGDAGFNGGSPATATEVAVVTGAGAGLGRAIALGLAAAGYGIIAVDQDLGGAAAASTQIQGYGVRALPLAADLRDARSLDSIVAVAAEWGGPAVLVNSVADATGTPALDLASAMLLSQLMLDPMRGRGGGAIVNIAPDTAALARYTAGLAGPASSFGVRAMGVGAAGSAHPADVVAAVLTLVQQGAAGSVTEL